jgi:hypothetical protein
MVERSEETNTSSDFTLMDLDQLLPALWPLYLASVELIQILIPETKLM